MRKVTVRNCKDQGTELPVWVMACLEELEASSWGPGLCHPCWGNAALGRGTLSLPWSALGCFACR